MELFLYCSDLRLKKIPTLDFLLERNRSSPDFQNTELVKCILPR